MFSSTEINHAREFTNRLSGLLRTERTAMADFIAALAEFDRKRLWEPLGFTGVFGYLRRELGMSTGAAYYRKVAAELVRKCPEVLEALRSGKLCITAVPHLARVLTPENHDEVLPRFLQASRSEARHLAAALDPDPNPPTRDVVTQARSHARSAGSAPLVGRGGALSLQPYCASSVAPAQQACNVGSASAPVLHDSGAVRNVPSAANQAVAPIVIGRPVQRDDIEPLTADKSRLHTTVTSRCLRLLEAARAALSHSHPRANAGEIMEAALGALLAEVAKRKHLVRDPRKPKAKQSATDTTTQAGAPNPQCSAGAEPQTKAPAQPGEHGRRPRRARADIPAHVEREVRRRDQERCQWPLASGGICGETHAVEIDHVVPEAMGGQPTVSNLRLLCRQHNLTAARIAYGDEFMARFTGERREVSD